LSFDASVKIHQSGAYTSTKNNKSGAGGLYGYFRHIDRKTDKENGKEVHHSNENINPDFTMQNESFYKDEKGNWVKTSRSSEMVQAVNRRIDYAKENGARIYDRGKNDTTIVRPLLIQLDEETISQHEDTWIQDTIEELENMFGKENIVGFCVHRDETSTHIHVVFTPVYEYTDKNGNYKCSVSQTKFFKSPKELAGMHKKLRVALQDKGYDIEQENKAIDEITLPGFEDLAKKAKYEEPVSAEAFAMQIVAAQKKTGQAFLNDREDDVDKSGVKDVTPTSNNGGQGEDNDPFGDIIDQMYPQTK